MSDMLDEEEVSKYWMLIGSTNRSVKLERIDVVFAANTLAKYSYAPRHGHLKTVLRAFGHLNTIQKVRLSLILKF